MSIVDDKIKSEQKTFEKAVNDLIKYIESAVKLDLDDKGNIIPNEDNLNRIVNISGVYDKAVEESGFIEAVDEYLEDETDIIKELSK